MNVIERIQQWVLIALAFMFPLAFLTTTQEFFVTNKHYLVLAVVVLSLILLAIYTLMRKKLYIIGSPFGKVLLTLVAIRALSVFFASPNTYQALFVLPHGLIPMIGLLLLYYIVIYISGSQRKKIDMISPLTVGTAVAAVVSIIFFFQPLRGADLPPHLIFLQSPRFSSLGNTLDTLIMYGFGIVASLGMALQYMKSKKSSRIGKNIALAVIMIIASGLAVYIAYNPADETQQAGIQLPPTSISWYAAIETLKSPRAAALGAGVDNYGSVFTLVKPATYNATELWQLNFNLSRSALLHLWTESGVLAFIVLLLAAVFVSREVHGLYKENDKKARMFMFLGAYLGVVWVALPISYITLFITFVYFISLAQASNTYNKEAFQEFDVQRFIMAYIGFAILLVALAGALGYYSGRVYASEYYFKKSIDAIRTNNGQDVYNNLQRAIQMNPRIEKYRSQFAQINLLLANNLARQERPEGEELSDQDRQAIAQFVQQAIAEGKALVALNPNRPANWNTLAVIYRNIVNVAQGADAWTVASYREAIRRDPNNPQLRLNLGGMFYAAQNYEAAIESFRQAVVLKPDWANAHYNLAWALYQNGNVPEAVAVMQNVLQLIDESSADFTTAQENLALFQEDLPAEGEEPTTETTVPEGAADENPLELPASSEAVISPPLELPEDSGPDNEIEAAPTPATDEETAEETAEPTSEPTPTPVS